MARVKFEYERSLLLELTTKCVIMYVILSLIKHTSCNSPVHHKDSHRITEYSTGPRNTTSSHIEINSLNTNISTLNNESLNSYVTEVNLGIKILSETKIKPINRPESTTERFEDEYVVTNYDLKIYVNDSTTIDPMYDYEEISTTDLQTDTTDTAPTEHITRVNDIDHPNIKNSNNTTSISSSILQSSSNDIRIKTESTTLTSSTKFGERSSKHVDNDKDDSALFQFWSTMSGNSNKYIEKDTGETSTITDELSIHLVTTLSTVELKDSDEPQDRVSDVPSPEDDLAKNLDDMDIDQQTDETSTTEILIPLFEDVSFDNITANTSLIDKNFMDAAEYGIMKMNELYGVQEPKLYHMGLVLERDDPARFVAAFNWQSEEAKNISKYGYASLQAYMYLHNKFPDELESRASTVQDEEQKENESDGLALQPPRPKPPRSSLLRQQCPLTSDPRCPPASKRYRTHDGTCNNLRRLRWGSALSAVQRFLPPEYGDGVQSVRRARSGSPLPSARTVSEAVHTPKRNEDFVEAPVTHMLMQWGQFLDHDITSSSQARGFNGSIPKCCENGGREFVPSEFLHPECLPIFVPDNDSFYAPRGIRCLEFLRSSPAPRSGCEFGHREQLNQVTAYIDGSPVYSSSAKQSDKLRLFRNGLLQYGRVQARRPVLPPDVDDEEVLCRGGAVDASCFKAGDGRVNEHPGLVAMHIVWLRKHNRLATELSHLNPHWSDEKIYQETRKIVGAFIQHITYREFLPIILGPEVMKLFELELNQKGFYKGYSTKVNPSPANSFGAAAFRFGHSLVQDTFMRYDHFHRPIHNNVSLHKELTNPSNIWSFGAVDRLLLGLINQPSQRRDEFISPELTNHLFQTPRFSFGMDLASINIQRGRDHGIPPYVQWREPCGLSSVIEWEDLLKIMPLRAVRNLEKVYRDIDDIDLFTGGIAERPVIGGLVGPTFACIIAQQFANLRKGDRFWYENGGFESSFTPAQLQQVRKITLSQILCQTMENVDTIQPFTFLIPDNFRNQRLPCHSGNFNNFNLTPWTEGNLNNDIDEKDFDKVTKSTFTPTTNNLSSHNINGLLSDSFSDSLKKTTAKNRKTTTRKPISLDDKLDVPTGHQSETSFSNTGLPNRKNFHTTGISLSKPTIGTLLTTKPSLALNDKLDFLRKNSKNQNSLHKTQHTFNETSKRSLPDKRNKSDSSNAEISESSETYPTTAIDKSVTQYDMEQKTFSLTDKMYNLLSGFMSTQTLTKRPPPTRKPQVIVYQKTPTTKKPQKYTYLINIVPKPTTPVYDDKEVVKITVQTEVARPTANRRPIYNNNRLEYRPVASDYSSTRPQHNRPYNTIDKYDVDDNYRPVPTYLGSQSPINNNPVSAQHNYYGFSTVNDLETTTKRYDLFNRPTYNYNSYGQQQDYLHNRPTYNYNSYGQQQDYLHNRPSHDSSNNHPSKPNRHPTRKPTTTGITIYIDNKVHLKPQHQDDISSNSYDTQSAEETDNVPLFTRPTYNRPLSQRPLTDYYYSKPISDNPDSYNQNTYNNNDHLVTWTQTPNPPQHSVDSDYTVVSYASPATHKEKPLEPTRLHVTPRPSHVSLHLASEYGSQQLNDKPNDISIVINPLLEYKTKTTTRPIGTTKAPTKYYYIRNVLYTYPHPADNILISKTSKRRHEIVKENYNNPWSRNTQHQIQNNNYKERRICFSENGHSDECLIVKNKSNMSPVHNIDSKEFENTPIDPSTSYRKDNSVNQVFFDVIPSENSPVRWLYYKEKPENNSIRLIMPEITSDPLASKELPRPIIFTKFSNIFSHTKKRT